MNHDGSITTWYWFLKIFKLMSIVFSLSMKMVLNIEAFPFALFQNEKENILRKILGVSIF